MSPLAEPHDFRRIFTVRDRVGSEECRHTGAADDVVAVVLQRQHVVVVRRRLPGELRVETRADLVPDRHRAARIGVLLKALRAEEVEQLVLFDRTAELRREVHVLLGDRGRRKRRILQRDRRRDVVRSQAAVGAEDVEQAAVTVAARLRDRVHDRASEPAVFRRRAQPLNLDFLHHVVVVEGPGAAAFGVARVDAVDEQRVRRAAFTAVHRAAVGAGHDVEDVDGRARDRRVVEKLLRDFRLCGAALHVDDRRLANDVDVLADAADRHRKRHVERGADRDGHVLLLGGFEARELGAHNISARIDGRKSVRAVRIRHRGLRTGLAGQRYGDARQDAALLVFHDTAYRTGEYLRRRRCGQQEENGCDHALHHMSHGLRSLHWRMTDSTRSCCCEYSV